MREILVLVFLGFNAWTDLRKKQISLVTVAVFSVVMLVRAFCTGGISWELLLPVGIGCFFLAVSIVTKGAVGMGDGWLIMALGLALEMEEFVTALLVGLLCCAAWAGILMSVFQRGRNTEIPFVPFLLVGYIGGVLVWR